MVKNIKLNMGGPCAYSKGDQELFSLLSEKDKISSNEIAKALYKNSLTARNSVIARMKYLSDKVDLNKEKFKIKKSERRGPWPVEFWLEKRA